MAFNSTISVCFRNANLLVTMNNMKNGNGNA